MRATWTVCAARLEAWKWHACSRYPPPWYDAKTTRSDDARVSENRRQERTMRTESSRNKGSGSREDTLPVRHSTTTLNVCIWCSHVATGLLYCRTIRREILCERESKSRARPCDRCRSSEHFRTFPRIGAFRSVARWQPFITGENWHSTANIIRALAI